jgi:hypothetical protein
MWSIAARALTTIKIDRYNTLLLLKDVRVKNVVGAQSLVIWIQCVKHSQRSRSDLIQFIASQ